MQVTVAFVNMPKPGMTFGSIKTTDGAYFNVEGEDLHRFRGGQTFDFMPREVTAKATGKKFYWVPKGFDPGGSQEPAKFMPPNHVGQPNGFTGVTGTPLPVRPAGNGSTYSTPKQMFIMGVVGRAMGSGKFGVDDILDLTAKAAEAWDLRG